VKKTREEVTKDRPLNQKISWEGRRPLQLAGKGEDAVEIPAKIMGRGKVVVLGNNHVAIETGV